MLAYLVDSHSAAALSNVMCSLSASEEARVTHVDQKSLNMRNDLFLPTTSSTWGPREMRWRRMQRRASASVPL